MKNKKEILYPIFLKISQSLTDTFWVYLFEDIAYGICPFGTYIESETLSCNFKGKQFRYIFSDKSEETIKNDLISIFTTKLNIYSKIDYLKNRTNFGKGLQLSYLSWKDIKKKSIKDILIENFVLSLKSKYNLSDMKTRKVLSLINMTFTFKLISTQDIIYDAKECKIIDIIGLNIDTLNAFFQLSSICPPATSFHKENATIYGLWNQMILEMKN